MLLLHKHKIKHKINPITTVQRLKFFLLNSERGLWYDGTREVRLIRKFQIGPSLSNRIGIIRLEFESNLEASQVPRCDETFSVFLCGWRTLHYSKILYKISRV